MIACNDISLSGTESFVNINGLFCGMFVFDEFVLYVALILGNNYAVILNKLFTQLYIYL